MNSAVTHSTSVPTKLLGARIRRARKMVEPRMSQQDLADAVGCSRVHIIRLEQGVHRPADSLLANIASHTGQPMTFFLKEAVTRKPRIDVQISAVDRALVEQATASLVETLMAVVKHAKTVEYHDEEDDVATPA